MPSVGDMFRFSHSEDPDGPHDEIVTVAEVIEPEDAEYHGWFWVVNRDGEKFEAYDFELSAL